MGEWSSKRLRVIWDDRNARIIAVRRRPEGIAFNFAEELDDGWALTQPPQVETEGRAFLEHPFGTLGPMDFVRISAQWETADAILTRVFRTLASSLAERMEFAEFTWFCEPDGEAAIEHTLLSFRRVVDVDSQNGRLHIVTRPYDFWLTIESEGAAPSIVEHPEDGVALKVSGSGPYSLRVSLAINNTERITGDSATYLIPARSDMFLFHLVAFAPALMSGPLSAHPAVNLLRPSPALFYTSVFHARRPLWQGMRDWFSRVPRTPPQQFPYFDRIRTSHFLMIWNDADARFDLGSLTSALAGLPARLYTSLQQILVLTSDRAAHEAVLAEIARISPLIVGRVEQHTPGEIAIRAHLVPRDGDGLETAMGLVHEMLENVRFDPPVSTRADFRRAMLGTAPPLPPLGFDFTPTPLTIAAFAAAARLRAPRRESLSAEPTRGWPLPVPMATPEKTTADMARFLLADIALHESRRSNPSDEPYAAGWLQALDAIESGRSRAGRLVFAVVDEVEHANWTRLLPAVLYASHVAAPLLAFRVSAKAQTSLIESWARLGSAIARYFLAIATNDGVTAKAVLPRLEEERDRFQATLVEIWPREYIDLVRRVRPGEIINFSALPLDWLDIDGIPLGFHAKTAAIRSRSVTSDWGQASDLVAAYTSLTSPDLRPHREALNVLLLAPTYRRQAQVNDFTSRGARWIRAFFDGEKEKGREVNVIEPARYTRDTVRKAISSDWSLLVYLGHAEHGRLRFDDFVFSAAHVPERAVLGTTVLLLGCDTNGALNLSGSVASELVRLGARGVFATSFPLPTAVATGLLQSLLHFLFTLNLRFGDVQLMVRHDALYQQLIVLLATELYGRPIRPEVTFASPYAIEPETFVEQWDKLQPIHDFFRPVGEAARARFGGTADQAYRKVLSIAALSGMALTFAGDLRSRLFDF